MAKSAIDAGYRVRVYSRWHPGQRPREDRGEYEVIRVPSHWRLAVPGLRRGARRRAAEAMAAALPAGSDVAAALREDLSSGVTSGARLAIQGAPHRLETRRDAAAFPGRVVRRLLQPLEHRLRPIMKFPFGPLGWAAALELVAEPADIWHGMWAGSLPALGRMRSRHGGRAIYDSRDIFMESRGWARLAKPMRLLLQFLERRWAQHVDLVLTVNESYAEILARLLSVPRPPVVMNCPARWVPPSPHPDLIRAALGIAPDVGIALYQGRLQSDRGIEQAMEAILSVPDAVLVLLGFGRWEHQLAEQIRRPPYSGRVFLLPAVPPDELVAWTASADVAIMAIQPTSLNHRWTTPQKLFESLAAGTPVVASDLPGMAEIVQPTRTGILVDPISPDAIAAAIREILEAPPDERAALRMRVREAAWDRFNWESQVITLLALYQTLLPDERLAVLTPRRRRTAGPVIRLVHEAGAPPSGAQVEVVLDPTWVPPEGSAEARLLSMTDLVEAVLSDRDLGTEAMDRLDTWAETAQIVQRMTLQGTSFWYGLRLYFWSWLMGSVLWLAVIRRLLDDYPETVGLEYPPDADPQLIVLIELVAEARGLSFEAAAPASREARIEPETGPGTVVPRLRSSGLVGRLRSRLWPPVSRRRHRTLMRRLERLARDDRGRLFVVEAHVQQRVNGPGGPRLMNPYLGPVVDELAGTRLDPIELDIRADLSRDGDWQRLNESRSARKLASSILAEFEGELSMASARGITAPLLAAIKSDDTPLVADDIDLGPALRREVSRRAAGTLPRRLRDIAQIRALLQRLRPAGLLIADEYHRQEWLAACALEGIPTGAVQHGIIHATHVGYVHRSRPPELRLPDRTYVFGEWERDLLLHRSVYRPEEVVVGGSPRLDLVGQDVGGASAIRHDLGVADGSRMVVLSGSWGAMHRRFYYPIALRHLFDRTLPGLHLVVKLHPTEVDEGPYRALISNVAVRGGFEPPPISVVQTVDLYELLNAADAHLGVRSTVTTEAVVVGTPNLLASGLLGADPLDYVKAGVASPVRDGGDLLAALEDAAVAPIPEAIRTEFVTAHFDSGGGAARIAEDLLGWMA